MKPGKYLIEINVLEDGSVDPHTWRFLECVPGEHCKDGPPGKHLKLEIIDEVIGNISLSI